MQNVMDVSREAFQADALLRLSGVLQESKNATQRGVYNAVPASLTGLAEHARHPKNAEALLSSFRAGDYPHVAPGELARLVGDPWGTADLAASGENFLSR